MSQSRARRAMSEPRSPRARLHHLTGASALAPCAAALRAHPSTAQLGHVGRCGQRARGAAAARGRPLVALALGRLRVHPRAHDAHSLRARRQPRARARGDASALQRPSQPAAAPPARRRRRLRAPRRGRRRRRRARARRRRRRRQVLAPNARARVEPGALYTDNSARGSAGRSTCARAASRAHARAPPPRAPPRASSRATTALSAAAARARRRRARARGRVARPSRASPPPWSAACKALLPLVAELAPMRTRRSRARACRREWPRASSRRPRKVAPHSRVEY